MPSRVFVLVCDAFVKWPTQDRKLLEEENKTKTSRPTKTFWPFSCMISTSWRTQRSTLMERWRGILVKCWSGVETVFYCINAVVYSHGMVWERRVKNLHFTATIWHWNTLEETIFNKSLCNWNIFFFCYCKLDKSVEELLCNNHHLNANIC